jgi:hypothetical protein
MLHSRAPFIAPLALLLAACTFVLALPAAAGAQGAFGLGVTIAQGQGRPLPTAPLPPAVRYQGARNRYFQLAYGNGYTDGHEKGIEDGRHWRSFDPERHRRYRDADHRYDRRYGPRVEYQRAYRDGFLAGYRMGYREAGRYRGYSRDWDPRRRPY